MSVAVVTCREKSQDWAECRESARLSSFQGRKDEPFVLMDDFTRCFKRFHGAGDTDAMSPGQKAQILMGQWKLDDGSLGADRSMFPGNAGEHPI